MADWAVWLIAGGCLAVAEVLTLTLVLGMLAIGGAAAAISSAVGVPVVGQLIVFGVADAVLLSMVLPIARRHRHMPAALRSGTARLVGERARALTDVTTREGGQVRIGGENWSARPYDERLSIPAGSWVDVLAIDGATAVVHLAELPPAST